MDVAWLVLEYMKTLLWPLILLLSILLFRTSIGKLILRLQSAKVAGAEANFEVKVEDAAHQIEDAKAKLTQPRNSSVRPASDHLRVEQYSEQSEEGDSFTSTVEEDEADVVSAVVPNVGNLITHSEFSRMRHPSRGKLLVIVSETITATGLPRAPRFGRVLRRRGNWQLDIADLWNELDRYLDGLSYSLVTALSSNELDDYTQGGLRSLIEYYHQGVHPEDLFDRVGRWLALRSISAVSIGISKLREIEHEMRDVSPITENPNISGKYRESCEGVVTVLDVIFRQAGRPAGPDFGSFDIQPPA